MNVPEARILGRDLLSSKDTPQLDADLLIGHVLGRTREQIVAEPELSMSSKQVEAYRALLECRASGEPVAYLTGNKWWFRLDLFVTRDVLIPRPETEMLVEVAIEEARAFAQPVIVDVGTGSGAIALAVASAIPDARIIATDLSEPALAVARQNAHRLGLAGRIEFRLGNLLDPVTEPPTILVANLPYIREPDRASLSPEVLSEPGLALFAGADGLDAIRHLLTQFSQRGWSSTLLLELDPRQEVPLRDFAGQIMPGHHCNFRTDLSGRIRLVSLCADTG